MTAGCVDERRRPESFQRRLIGTIVDGAADAAATTADFGRRSSVRPVDLQAEQDDEDVETHAKSMLMTELAHDLCSPLSAISVIARTLLEQGVSDGQSADLEAIARISERAIGMVHDVLDQARIAAGHEVARTETCDLHRLVEEVTEVSRQRAKYKGLEFKLVTNPSLPRRVRTDGARLQRILGNVLDNAFKYTPQGSISLSLDARRGAVAGRVRLIFEIRDTGIGIPIEDQDRIFDRFVRLADTSVIRGAGLGLAIAAQMTVLLGGVILVESAPGMGSCFRIELPVEQADLGTSL